MINIEKKVFPSTGDTLIYFIWENGLKKNVHFEKLDLATGRKISKKSKLQDFQGKKDESLTVEWGEAYENIILYGLGKHNHYSFAGLKEAMANATRIARTLKSRSLHIFYSTLMGKDFFEIGKSISLGYYLSEYSFDAYKGKEALKKMHAIEDIHFYFEDKIPNGFEKGVNYGWILSKGVTLARNLVNQPASYLSPETLVGIAFDIEKQSKGKINVQVLDRDECERLGMGAYLGVARGSDKDPKFIVLKYRNPNSKLQKTKKICLVGKSITFDSGGLSLKPAKAMETMKMDMAGGAVVLGVFHILTETDSIRDEIWGVLPACENMPSGNALRPGDVISALNGKTIEVLNTDAEGRLTLADAVSYAEKHLQPDLIIDIATLTGACMVALGTDVAGLFGNDQQSINAFLTATRKEGEEAWELPLYKPYLSSLKSEIADIKNVGGTGYAGAISGALFIAEFVKKTNWLHIDIAGPAYSDKTKGVISKGGTGWGILSIISLLTKK